MKGVILAAGEGARLTPLTLHYPKPLLRINGRSLLAYTIEAFTKVGITELVLVIGHKGEIIRRHIGSGKRYGVKVTYVFNPNYRLGNALSVLAAQTIVLNEPFVLAMADHMISSHILRTLLITADKHNTLCVDRQASAPPQLKDATRVWVDDTGFITRIGKKIKHWNAIDTGVFLFTPQIFTAISSLIQTGHKKYYTISNAVTWMIENGYRVRACEVSGAFWMDVDTLEDLFYVEDSLQKLSVR